ncbi:heavy metal translocating P-type ATPase [Oceanicoccus sagamiensis]|uniref:Copper-translocating P-type ATPase n=1 Tax=Oceanicoccus sagamiensis TaxID=716816 RepID=A0A1X9NGW4_9GAMM|nr:heavy metal translocating P-type ATPase [Oceanicoccus sagamiensis]ARN74749.1 copper-translocating P-type ATPase [Oceanicoccus sagamiensis]
MPINQQASPEYCFHCGLTVTTGEPFCAELNGQQANFCCPACRAVAITIVDNGLSSFYQFHETNQQAPDALWDEGVFAAFDDDAFQQRYITRSQQSTDMAQVQLLIGGMHCAACVWLLEQYLLKLPAIEKVSVSLTEQKAVLHWRLSELPLSEVCRSIALLGYQAEPYSQNHLQELRQRENHQALRRLGVAGIGMMQVGMFAIALYAGALQSMALEYRDFMRWVSFLVATPVVFYAAQPFFIGAWRGIKMKSPGMDLPVALAIGLAYLASVKATWLGAGDVYYDSVTMFTFLLLSGRYLEMRARHFGGRLTTDLNSLLPSTVLTIDPAGNTQSLPLFKVALGDKLLIKPGQVIPADGVVLDGYSSVDESQMTGEFSLQSKVVGDDLVAGTCNGGGTMTLRVNAVGADLKLQSINQLLQTAQSTKPTMARMADKLASYFVVSVLLLAAATYSYWHIIAASDQAFWIVLSVLVVSCPCALSLATPAVLTAATNRLRDLGLLVTKPYVWEKMAAVTDIVCDKTGTLTRGELAISAVKPQAELSSQQCLDIAAALERYSEHPIAKAFTHKAQEALAVSEIEVIHSAGLEGHINGETYRLGRGDFASALYGLQHISIPADFEQGQWLLLSSSKGAVCWFRLQDSLREDAQALVSGLQQQRLTVHLLSGDASGAAEQLSARLGIDRCTAGASPEQKLAYIQQLQAAGAKVLMLGDGINDVPVLAAADVSVAMSNASNLAKTHADSILLSGHLTAVLQLFSVASTTRSIIKQNLVWALSYNLLAIPLAAMAMIPPYLAAIGMSLSSLVVVLNALRVQRKGQPAESGNDTARVFKEVAANG